MKKLGAFMTAGAIAIAALVLALPTGAQDRRPAPVTAGGVRNPDDSGAVAAVVARYHRALEEGDSATALSLLAPDATILESGGMESRAEYRSHHLSSDIEFARAVPSRQSALHVTVRGDVAWVRSTSISEGQFRGRTINAAGAELMVLSREVDGWRIRAIHWSSRTRRSPG